MAFVDAKAFGPLAAKELTAARRRSNHADASTTSGSHATVRNTCAKTACDFSSISGSE